MNLTGNTLLITGGSSGIGLALAKQFLALGNTVIITGRSEARLAEAKRECEALHTFACDAAKPEQLVALGKLLEEQFPSLNVLINNAGVMRFLNVGQAAPDLKLLTEELDINLAGPIHTVSVLLEQLKRNRGTIVNVSSGLAFVPLQAAPIYCAAKAALHSYTISLRYQLRPLGVEVIELMPPAVHTNLAVFPEDAHAKVISTDELMTATLHGLRAGHLEIRPGQANQLHWMSRLMPKFIADQLAKGSAKLIPQS